MNQTNQVSGEMLKVSERTQSGSQAHAGLLRGGRMTKWKGEAASYASSLAHFVSVSAGQLFVVGLLSGLAAGPAFAADRYWDANGNGSGWGGTGVWNLSNFTWSPNSDGVSGPYNQAWSNTGLVPGTPDNAIFGGTSGTVTLGSAVTVNTITFATSGYTIAGAGNTLTVAGTAPTITTNLGVAAAISASVGTSGGFTKAGAGALTLSGANNFGTGALNVNAGTLTLSGSNTFTGNVNVATGTSLTMSAANTFTGNINVSGTLTASDAALGAAGNIVTLNNGSSFAASGALNSTRQIVLNGSASISGGAGSALITGTGPLSVASGVAMNNDGNTYTGTTTLWGSGTSGSTVAFTSVRNAGVASALGASGDIVLQGVNNFNDNFVYTGDGDTTDRTFRLTPGSNASIALGNNGTGTLSFTGTVSLEGGARGIFIGANSADIDFSSGTVVGASASPLTLTGGAARTITLGGANSFTTGVTITTATVVASTLADIGSNSSLGTGSANSEIHINNGTLRYTGDGDATNRTWQVSDASAALQNDGSGGLNLSGAMLLNAGALNLRGGYGGLNAISGNITGVGGITANGAGTWVLSGTNNFTGPITVEGGTLRAGSATALGASGAATVNGGTLDLAGFSNTFTRLDGTGGEVALGGANMTLDIANGVIGTYSGNISGSGSLTKTGAGRQILKGANTYTGATNVAIGTLELSFAGAGGPTSDIISSSSTLNMLGGTLVVTGVSGEGNTQTFNGLNITAGGNRVNATNATVNFGAVNRTSGIIDFGIGTGAVMTVAPGTTLGGWATVNGSDYADVNASNQIIAFTDYDLKDNAGTWVDNDIVADTAGTANSPFTGIVSDAGDGVVQLGGLRYAAAANSNVTVGVGQTLGVDGAIIIGPTVGGTSQTINGGSMRGAAGGVLGIQQSSAGTFTISSTVVDNMGPTGLTVLGTGTGAGTGKVVLGNAANTYSGPTRVTLSTLEVGTLANGGTPSSIGTSSADPSNLVLEAARLSYTGGTASTNRGMTLARSGALANNMINIAQSGTNLTIGGELVSPDGANLVKEGVGTLTLTNANSSYSGTTTVSAGTLAVTSLGNGGANSTIGSSSSDSANLVIANGATFRYDGATATSNRGFTLGNGTGGVTFNVSSAELTMSGNAVGTNNLVKDGAGVLILAGNNTYNSNTVSGGTLRAGSTTAFGQTNGMMTVASGARLELGTFSNTVGGLLGAGTVDLGAAETRLTLNSRTAAFTGTITGAGELAVTGGAVQTLSGCNHTYTGATVISNGTLITDCIRNGNVASGIGASPAAADNLVIANNGSLQYTGGTVTTDRGFHLANGWGGINVTQAGTTLEFTGNVTNANSGGLVKDGSGALKLSGNNSFVATLVREGTLIAGSAQAFGSGGLYINAGALVDMTGFSNTVAALSDNGGAGGEIRIADKTLTLSGGNAVFSGRITGTTGRLVKNGGEVQTLTGCNNNYGGGTTINAGWLVVSCLADGGANSSIGASSADATNLVLGTGAVLSYQGDGDKTNRRFTLSGSHAYIRNYGTEGALEFTNTAAVTYNGTGTRQLRLGGTNTQTNIMAAQIVNNGGSATNIVKEEAGTWRLTSTTSNYSGGTTISQGVLEVTKLANGEQASSIGASQATAGNLLINTEGHLRYVGSGDSTNRLFTLGTGATYIESSGKGVAGMSEEERRAFHAIGNTVTPMKRHGTAEEVARAVLFLAFEATFTTGTKLAVDGGLGQKISVPQ